MYNDRYYTSMVMTVNVGNVIILIFYTLRLIVVVERALHSQRVLNNSLIVFKNSVGESWINEY